MVPVISVNVETQEPGSEEVKLNLEANPCIEGNYYPD